MPHLFRPYADSIVRTVLLAIVVAPFLAVGLGYWVTASEYVTDRTLTLDQPVPFSHQHHAGGLGIDCRYCHAGAETSVVAGVPPTHVCMTCHSQLYTQTAMLAPIRESLAKGEPIHWNRVNRLPDYVYFDHSIHIAKGVGCSSCHGNVATMPLMRQSAPLTMAWCLDCHRNPAPNLRVAADVFDPAWQPPKDQDQRGAMLAHQNIDNAHLTDCSVCHR